MRKRKHQAPNGQSDNANGNNDDQQQQTGGFRKMRLPPRWLYCPPMGKIVSKKFLPMKTPLDESYDHLIESPKYRFHPGVVFQMPLVDSEPGAKIGLWIDLTNSDHFYNGDEVRKHGCKFLKMKMVGHGESPSVEQTKQFISLVDEFFTRCPNDVVVVHCTHGFNRTGFLISAYLYEKEDLSIEMAVREFAECRPKGIYKQGYLDDLRQRYGDEDDEPLESPGRPLWENGPVTDEEFTNGVYQFESERDSKDGQASGITVQPTTSNSNSTTSSSTEGTKANATPPVFMDGKVPQAKFVDNPELRKSIQEKVRKFCGYNSKGFAGSQPVSLEGQHGNNNIRFLNEEPYMVSWKADGVRYLVLIDGKDRVFALDRDNNPFVIEKIAFVRRQKQRIPTGQPIEEEEYLVGTLVDAEMVIDHVKVGNEVQEVPRLLIYDLIAFQGNAGVREQPFKIRFEMIKIELIQPRMDAFRAVRIRREEEPIGIRRKDFWAIESTYKIFEPNFLSCHEVDGLAFQPANRPYTAGRFDYLLKWKPPEMSSIDFRLEIKKVQRTGELAEWVGELHVLHLEQPFALMKATKQLMEYNNKIVECKFVRSKNAWEFMRQRTDKSHPNAYSTALSVWNTIQHPIYKQDLLNFIAKFAYKKQEPRPSCK